MYAPLLAPSAPRSREKSLRHTRTLNRDSGYRQGYMLTNWLLVYKCNIPETDSSQIRFCETSLERGLSRAYYNFPDF
jgi:hypothetical protein